MAILLVVGLGVVIFLLWCILSVQTERAQIEAARLANTVAKDRLASFTARFGTEEQARMEGRLIEYVRKLAATFGMSEQKVRDHLLSQKQLRRDLILESFERGVRCEYFDDDDHRDFAALHSGYPGPEPRIERFCMQCDASRDWLPLDSEACPFCGAATEVFSPDDEIAGHESERATWRRDMEKWERYRKLFPERAAQEEARSNAAHAEANQQRKARFEQLRAESKPKPGSTKGT